MEVIVVNTALIADKSVKPALQLIAYAALLLLVYF
jgi:hypothetical protein